jgi:hypothetical protein
MDKDTAQRMLVDTVKTVLKETDADERIEKIKNKAKQRQERPDTLWFELILSMATLRGSSGSTLATEDEYYNQVQYQTLLEMNEEERVDHLEEVLLDAGVNMHLRKADFINAQVDRIDSLGGLDSAQEDFEARDGKEAKMDFLREFKGIGDKYARNIGMDIFHPDFQDTIALDARIRGISDQLCVEFDSYEQHEQFYISVAERLGITAWELDRILYRYTDEVIAEIKSNLTM